MSAHDPASAVEQLFDPLQRALSCVTASVLTGRRYHESLPPHLLYFDESSDPSPLGRSAEWALSVRHFYRLTRRRSGPPEGRWQITSVGYIYALYDQNLARIVAYHWPPIGGGNIAFPHLHVGRQFAHPSLPPDVRASSARLVRSHLPTGPIMLPRLLRLAVAEFDVQPLRDDWSVVLDQAEGDLRRSFPAA